MVSLMSSKSWSSLRSALSDASNKLDVPPSPVLSVSSTSSLGGDSSSSSSNSIRSLNAADEENATITVSARVAEKRKSQEDLRLLAISTHITELQYTISDIQTRIFEIQELRHQTQNVADIDTILSTLDDRLDGVASGVKAVNESMEPLLHSVQTPTQAQSHQDGEEAVLIRKHGAILEEWQGLQRDADLLKEELKEDKWLTVFRTVTDQADGMMNSLDKAINRCQDFLRQVNSGGSIAPNLWPPDPDRPEGIVPSTIEIFIALADTFEAKKRHYIPATTKVLNIIDKGVQERVTKNGECLRRHAECMQRWKSLQSRLARTDTEMDKGRVFLLQGEATPSEAGSSASGSTAVSGQYLGTPGASHRSGSKSTLTLSRSISPLRKIARKLKGGSGDPETPTAKKPGFLKTPSSEPTSTLRRQRTSIFGFKTAFPTTPTTPDKPGHRQTQSIAQVETPPGRRSDASGTTRTGLGPMKHAPPWNSSTKIEPAEEVRHERERTATLRPSPSRRPSALGFYQSLSGTSAGTTSTSSGPQTPYKRSLSRSSMTSSSIAASSRPWSPLTNSSASSSVIPPMPNFRPPSRSYGQIAAPPHTPRARPKTPSAIPAPRTAPARIPSGKHAGVNGTPERDRTASPTPGADSYFPETPSRVPPPRPPSRSMIPIPALHLSSASRPGTAMSQYNRPDSSMSIRGGSALTPSRSVLGGPPPSAFREASRIPSGTISRPGSRTGGSRMGGPLFGTPLHIYTPVRGAKDPLDAAVAEVCNSVPHAFVVERVDPPLKTAPEPGTEQRAIYAFSTVLGRKQLPLKFTAPGKTGDRRLLYRAGGGWNELRDYLSAHPA